MIDMAHILLRIIGRWYIVVLLLALGKVITYHLHRHAYLRPVNMYDMSTRTYNIAVGVVINGVWVGLVVLALLWLKTPPY